MASVPTRFPITAPGRPTKRSAVPCPRPESSQAGALAAYARGLCLELSCALAKASADGWQTYRAPVARLPPARLAVPRDGPCTADPSLRARALGLGAAQADEPMPKRSSGSGAAFWVARSPGGCRTPCPIPLWADRPADCGSSARNVAPVLSKPGSAPLRLSSPAGALLFACASQTGSAEPHASPRNDRPFTPRATLLSFRPLPDLRSLFTPSCFAPFTLLHAVINYSSRSLAPSSSFQFCSDQPCPAEA
ncbi:hypothetical protein PsYK624_023650 [Phanerochaete sordida]|uniref:Uncharacterized protein n=1 Tax=Phanerochaete sordida TaxID=48140 RepID=A0A9P3G1P1_9APHY|nr:hypothetical protein PsYK624_023650 [Phanerochaete sordida]